MQLKRIHHVAYRCRDAGETVEFYQRVLKMEFVLAIAEDQVPSTLHRVAPAMLEEWSRTKKAPRHAAWLHDKEFHGEKS